MYQANVLLGGSRIIVLAIAVPALGQARLERGPLAAGIGEQGLLLEVPAAGLTPYDGPGFLLRHGFEEWFGITLDDGGGGHSFVGEGRTHDWAGRTAVTPVSFVADGGSVEAVVRAGDVEVRTRFELDTAGPWLLVHVRVVNVGSTRHARVVYTREWRTAGQQGWLFPPDAAVPPAPPEIARRVWERAPFLPSEALELSFSYALADEAKARAVDVPLQLWTGGSWPSGLDVGATNGISWGDYDADGWIDMVAWRSGNLWRNVNGTDWAFARDLDDFVPPSSARYGCSFGDYDNDGRPDIATEPREPARMSLLRNLGSAATFVDVAPDPAIVDVRPYGYSETNCWGDADGDGNLDLFVPVYPPWVSGPGNFFLYNLGPTGPGGAYRFTEMSAAAGLDNPLTSYRPEGAQFADEDFDGDLDLYSNGTMYQNVSTPGVPRFLPMTPTASGIGLQNSLDEGAMLFDYDLDGDLDIFVAYSANGVKVWESYGDGMYFEAAGIVDSPLTGLDLGMSAEDWDQDGDIDFTTRQVFRRNMLLEQGSRRFTVATHGIPAGHLTSATPAWGDWDRDGDLDCALGNWQSTGHFYGNTTYGPSTPLPDRRYVRVKIVRTSGAVPAGLETAYGAVAEIRIAGDAGGIRRRKFVASGHGYLNQNEYTLHFGLPPDPDPTNPSEDLHLDVSVDLPGVPALGQRRIDRRVNATLGDINLATLTDREITVFDDGRARVNGAMTTPALASQVLVASAGGLSLPGQSAPLPVPTPAPGGGFWEGIAFDTTTGADPVIVKDVIVDGQLDTALSCGGTPLNVAIWDVTTPSSPVLVASFGQTGSSRNRRTAFPVDVALARGRSYRLVARVTTRRGTAIAAPVDQGLVTVRGGVAFASAAACDGTAVALAPLDASRIGVAFRFARETPGVRYLVGQGYGPPSANRVREYDDSGNATSVDFLAYGAGAWGTGVSGAGLDAVVGDEIVTGPGPGAVYGPHVRGFLSDGTPMGAVSYYAYGTLRFGVNAASADTDGDRLDEIVSGAGPGAIFGPHVRGWNVDGGTPRAIRGFSYFAYATLAYGVNVGGARLNGDPTSEILTGPGPGVAFAPAVRGWEHDGVAIRSINAVSFDAFGAIGYGVDVAGGDAHGDARAEILAAPGPGASSAFPSRFVGFDFDGVSVRALPGFDVTPYGTVYGGQVGAGPIWTALGPKDRLVTGAGRDPAAVSTVYTYAYDGTALIRSPVHFVPFVPGYGVNPAVLDDAP